jgi:hypothetical protein
VTGFVKPAQKLLLALFRRGGWSAGIGFVPSGGWSRELALFRRGDGPRELALFRRGGMVRGNWLCSVAGDGPRELALFRRGGEPKAGFLGFACSINEGNDSVFNDRRKPGCKTRWLSSQIITAGSVWVSGKSIISNQNSVEIASVEVCGRLMQETGARFGTNSQTPSRCNPSGRGRASPGRQLLLTAVWAEETPGRTWRRLRATWP